MSELLAKIIDAHGGMDRWKTFGKGLRYDCDWWGFFPLKGFGARSKPPSHDFVAARGTVVSYALRDSRSADEFHSKGDRPQSRHEKDARLILSFPPGPKTDGESIAPIHCALELGIN